MNQHDKRLTDSLSHALHGTHPDRRDCLDDPDSGVPEAMSMADPGEGGVGERTWCAVCGRRLVLVGKAGQVFWRYDQAEWVQPQSTSRQWMEGATTYRGEPLPEPGRVVVINAISVLHGDGRADIDHWVGTVLWTTATTHVVEHASVGAHYDDQPAPAPHVFTARRETLEIQLDDGRVAHLDSTAPGGGHWHYQTGEETAANVALEASATLLDTAAAESADAHVRRTLRQRARELRAATGAPRPRPGRREQPAGPRKPTHLALLAQNVEWWPAVGGPVKLADMAPRHRRNTLAMLRRQVGAYWMSYSLQFFDAPDDVQAELDAETPDEWLERQPLIIKLAELIAADQAAGVPDEPDATPQELDDYYRKIGLPGRSPLDEHGQLRLVAEPGDEHCPGGCAHDPDEDYMVDSRDRYGSLGG